MTEVHEADAAPLPPRLLAGVVDRMRRRLQRLHRDVPVPPASWLRDLGEREPERFALLRRWTCRGGRGPLPGALLDFVREGGR